MGSKIRTFIELLNAGNTYEAAKAASGVSENTGKIQYSKWKNPNKVVKPRKLKSAEDMAKVLEDVKPEEDAK